MLQPSLSDLSLKSLRCLLAIEEHGSLTSAARALNRTQPAVTRALQDLESQLGAALVDRHAQGAELTHHGRLLATRIREAEAQLALAAEAHASARRTSARRPRNPVFTMEISRQRLDAFLAVHELGAVGRAAERLGVTRAAVYDSLRVIEDLLELPLFERSGSGLRGTVFGDIFASHLALAFSLIQHGLDEIASLDGDLRGRLVVGTLPYSRTVLVPRTIRRVLQMHPRLRIATREGPYDVLERGLRNGGIDLIVGATRRHGTDSPLRAEDLFQDELAVIGGARHPLADRSRVGVREILAFGWVLPVASTPARQLFDEFLARNGFAGPEQVIETGSLSMTRSLLLESDRLALLSKHQVQPDLGAGILACLPIRLEQTFRPIGITRRAHSTPSPAARVFMTTLRDLTLQAGERLPPGTTAHTES